MNLPISAVISLMMSAVWCVPLYATAQDNPLGIYQLIQERMVLMKDVAGYKARQHLPVEDLKQEERILSKAREQSAAVGLSPQSTQLFVTSLMNASKAIQYRYMADWLAAPESDWTPLSLNDTIRPTLLTIDDQLLVSIKRYLANGGRFAPQQEATFLSSINVEHLSQNDKRQIYVALSQIEPGGK
ncbi:chorismate mutase [Pectobacterium brasiliense]|uniref:chorismate mutase n=1 Tax=Pectobacterium brasiliense TaxID=180957 RepID=UPI001968F199|nr:chorismate mutase [Pectobacterium brasiliense]MBN3263486.1 chorismate mutase [Pectobacterium brasiliense]